MNTAFRIVEKVFAGSAFDGEGARLYGGRWNSRGNPVVYVAQTLSQAILEILVHTPKRHVERAEYVFFKVEFDSKLVESVDPAKLAEGWNNKVVGMSTRLAGDRWLKEARSAVLRVPSVIAPGEMNYLLNPEHGQFRRIKIHDPQPLVLDGRLLGRAD
jgi:RES domain-containing protein